MAGYQAIGTAGEAIRRLLEQARPKEFANADIKLVQGSDFKPIELGVSLYLYRVAVSTARRNLPARTSRNNRRLRPPLPVDLFFLITPWAPTAEKQHRLLGWLMRTLDDTPALAAAALNPLDAEVFRPQEAIEIIHEPISVQDMNTLWQALKLAPQASVTYSARMVTIESDLEMPEAEPVQTRDYEYRTAVAP